MAEKQVFSFTLILAGVEYDDALENALYQSGCDDALLGTRCGEIFLDFDREAESMDLAVASARRSVESAGLGIQIVRVDPVK